MMETLIAQVVEARQRSTQLREQHQAVYAKWEADNRELIDALAAAKLFQEEAEGKLRAAALDTYNVTGDKHPAPGVEVKMGTRLVYNPNVAQLWGYEHGTGPDPGQESVGEVGKGNGLTLCPGGASPLRCPGYRVGGARAIGNGAPARHRESLEGGLMENENEKTLREALVRLSEGIKRLERSFRWFQIGLWLAVIGIGLFVIGQVLFLLAK